MNAGVAKEDSHHPRSTVGDIVRSEQVVIKPDPGGWRCQGSTVFDVAFGYVWAKYIERLFTCMRS